MIDGASLVRETVRSETNNPTPAPPPKWQAVTKFYSEVAEIWAVDGGGKLETLIAEIPMDPGDDLADVERKAELLASLPQQVEALQQAPAPPDWEQPVASDSKLEAVLLHWLGSKYLPWYRGQRCCALAKASAIAR